MNRKGTICFEKNIEPQCICHPNAELWVTNCYSSASQRIADAVIVGEVEVQVLKSGWEMLRHRAHAYRILRSFQILRKVSRKFHSISANSYT